MDSNIRTIYAVVLGCMYVLIFSYVFQPLTTLGFAKPDDHWMLLKNEWAQHMNIDMAYLKAVFTRVNQIQYSPVNTLYYNLVYRVNGFDPYYFHLSNLLVHFMNSVLIFVLVRKMLSIFSDSSNILTAYMVSLLWSIHPLNIEPVTWVSGSKILICTFLTLCALICFLKSLEKPGNAYLIYSAGFFIISFFCKELAMLTPVMCCLTAFCYYRKRQVRWPEMRIGVFLTITLLIAVGMGLVTARINHMDTQEFAPMASYPPLKRTFLIFYCVSFYASNLITPMGLHYHYPYPFQPLEPMPTAIYVYALFIVGIILLFYLFLRKSPYFLLYLLCAGIFIIQIGLYIQVIPMTRPAIVADRYMYLPSFALLLACVHLCQRHAWNKNIRYGKYIIGSVALIFTAYFTIYSHQMVIAWSSLDLR